MRTRKKRAVARRDGSVLRRAIVAALATAAIGPLAAPAGARAAQAENFADGAGLASNAVSFQVAVRGTSLSPTGRFRWSVSNGPTHTVDADCIVVVGNQAFVAGQEPTNPPGDRDLLTLVDNHATGQPDEAQIGSTFGPPHSCPPLPFTFPLVHGSVRVGTTVNP